jgi:hypothetical protein
LPNICEETSQHLLEIRSIPSPVPARILYRWAGGWVLIVLAEIKPELLETDSAGKRDSHARTATAEKRLRRLEILFVAAG